MKKCKRCGMPMVRDRDAYFCDNCGETRRVKPHCGRNLGPGEVAGITKAFGGGVGRAK